MLDKQLLIELGFGYCRLSYAMLARHFGLTVNAIKKRVNKLIERGVLSPFVVRLNRGLVGEGLIDKVFVTISTDGSEEEEAFIKQIDAFPTVYSVWKTTRKSYGVYSPVAGFSGLSELGQFLQGLDSVTNVEIDSVVPLDSPGRKAELSTQRWCYEFNFSKSDLLVLRCLKEDSRMPVSEIARRTRLSPKRVRKTLETFEKTRCVLLIGLVDESKGELVSALIKTRLVPTAISNQEFVYWLYNQYPFECWEAYTVADKPSMVLQYVNAHNIHKIDEMALTIKSASFTTDVDALVIYGDRRFRVQKADPLEEMLSNAGL
jgi:DNA-binding Lrp family transcriptional regulator